ncbi:MAG: hypothetical protein ACOZDY_01410 [Pseudomonadota bacterium]
MKEIKVTDLSQIKNELARYKKGKKLDIRHFNQVARLAWLGKIVLCPLDPEDPECRAYLLHLQAVDELTAQILTLDDDLNGQPFLSRIHILDGEQGDYLAQIFREGMADRVRALQELERRDFYFGKYFKGDAGGGPAAE